MTDVIILHGAWHQPAHYDDLVRLLRLQGFSVEVPDLYLLSLEDSTGLVEDIIATSEQPPLVLGHSFGGVTAGTVRGAEGLIFLAGWLLDVGESPGQLLAEVEKETGVPAAGLIAEPDSNGRLRLDPVDAQKNLYGDVDEPTAARAVELLRPEPPSIFGATPSHVSWRDTPSIYIGGRDDHAIAAPLISRFAARCSASETWKTSHSPYLSHPTAVADLVQRRRRNAGR
ncbi:alpha/beta hydrolase [Streptomyces sp. ME02-6987-2C]|uniref:alpha/beta hydrolase n=1 Tax=unclassified Streptomyces TaxID=2593676 RepID=UPI0029A48322|nr:MULTISPECIES: alpha/beta hydrolase [unclassified Streptomyces]MDX3371189.1 alpha/beta hydrolase [Streptomyces sp. ME02-6987-2C]MDX3426992.1 alpha/beta hydrolase [Streptomyces sp. ME02-6985-2c]